MASRSSCTSLPEPCQTSMLRPRSGATIDLAGRSYITDVNSGAGRSSFLGTQACTLLTSEENRSQLWNVDVSNWLPGSIELNAGTSEAFATCQLGCPQQGHHGFHSVAALLRTSPLKILQQKAHTHGTKAITLLCRLLRLDTALLWAGYTSNIDLGIVRCGAPDADPQCRP